MHIITTMNILNHLHILTSCAWWIVSVVGSCLFAYGLKQGELCRRDNDCETGLLCSDSGGESRTCQPPNRSNKQYSEFRDWMFKKSAGIKKLLFFANYSGGCFISPCFFFRRWLHHERRMWCVSWLVLSVATQTSPSCSKGKIRTTIYLEIKI